MPKTKAQKKQILDNLQEKIKKSKSVIFIKFNKLGVKDNESLRKALAKEGGEYLVAKKTLFNLALKNAAYNVDTREFDGSVAAVFGYADEVIPAKIINNFRKENEANKDKIEFLSGVLDGKAIDSQNVIALTQIPSKLELYAQIVGSLNSPISGFVNALAGNLRNLVYVLKAIEGKK